MNRKERRRLERKGELPKKEPVFSVTSKDMVKEALKGTGKKAMIEEIDRQILARDREFQLDVDTMVLWTLYHVFGWGKVRLKRFYDAAFKEHERMREYFQMQDLYPERAILKEKGIDVEAWYHEQFELLVNSRSNCDGFAESTDESKDK